MLYMKSSYRNIVYCSKKKKMETCTLKQNIRENQILLSTGGGATCRHNAYFIKKFLCDVTDGYAAA